ncbi:MAG: 4Fe-4S binding protein [Promethearchaeota archaeon]
MNEKECNGCRYCARICPHQAIILFNRKNNTKNEKISL